jgi:hypothetical protein
MVPLPLPDLLTVRSTACDASNVAVTVVGEVRVIVQGLVPAQPPPLQPENVEPVVAVAVRVTAVPPGKVPEQLAPQMMPDGVLIAVPLPAPIFTTARPKACAVAPHAMLE